MKKFIVSGLAMPILLLAGVASVSAQVTGQPDSSFSVRGVPATDFVFEPADAPHAVCPAFGTCPEADQVTTEYIGFGVDFTPFQGNPPVGVFLDNVDKFGGVNESGELDLLTPSCGRIVDPGTVDQSETDFVGIAAGFVGGPDDILLEVFDSAGNSIGSSIADDGTDADGDLIAEVSDPSASIASFCVSTPTSDTHGLHFVYLNNPATTGAALGVPTLSGTMLILLALVLAVVAVVGLRKGGVNV